MDPFDPRYIYKSPDPIDIYVLDGDLKVVGIVDRYSYKSLIWAKRYAETGDCEVYMPASRWALDLLKKGRYLARVDDDMICRINKVQIATDVEDGDFLTAYGIDTKAFLDQRIVWGTTTCHGTVEEVARTLVTDSCISPANPDRVLAKSNDEPLLALDPPEGLQTVVTEQISYKSVGEKIREYCSAYGYGYRFRADLQNRILKFGMYSGTDKRLEVVFSKNYDNLNKADYTDDISNIANTALIGGTGEGSERILDVYGGGFGVDRYELFVNASDMSPDITYEELTKVYPLATAGGTAYITGSGDDWSYIVGHLDIQVMSDEHLADLKAERPGGSEYTRDGQRYYRLYDAKAASVPSQAPADDETVTLENFVYDVYLLNRGKEKLSEYGRKVTFEAEIVPDVTFIYKRDYDLGDLITIENDYDIRSTARIVEIIEVVDTQNGHTVEPKYEIIEVVEGRPVGALNLATESDIDIDTERNVSIMVEGE